MRPSQKDEDKDDPNASPVNFSEAEKLREDMFSLMFNTYGPLNRDSVLDDTVKPHPRDPTGDECTCGSIKNYRHDTRKQSDGFKKVAQQFPLSRKFSGNQGAA